MEAALTAGFARGDTMITAKTVAAATGPTAPRPQYREPRPPGMAGRVMQIVAAGLLVAGAAAFLYRGLSTPVSHNSLNPIASVALPPVAMAPQRLPDAKPAETLPPDVVAALMKRGDQSLGLGDIAAARLLYQRAAEAGNAPAATALGKTYDPNFAAGGGKPDPARAVEWYRKAISLGDARAADLQKRLAGAKGS
jgi:TPR repeat protein